jgi:Fanconi-associated nuclease 1
MTETAIEMTCMPAADVFLTPFQDAPLDLNTPSRFYQNRRALIDDTLAFLTAATPRQLANMVAESWTARCGIVCRGVRWDSWTLSGLQVAACCVGGRGLAAVFRALCENYRHLSGGLPDLLVCVFLISSFHILILS